jgi:hypothetical protein
MHPSVAEDGAEGRSKNSPLRKKFVTAATYLSRQPGRRANWSFSLSLKSLSQAYSYEITIAVNQTGGTLERKNIYRGYPYPRAPPRLQLS